MIFHVVNRGNARRELFTKPADYDAFERVMVEADAQVPMRVLAYCLIPNHWHLLLLPHHTADLGRYCPG